MLFTDATSLRRMCSIVTLTSLLVFTSTDSSRLLAAGTESQPRSVVHPTFSGEDIYRGVFLGHGPVADLLPEVRNHLAIDNYVVEPRERATIRRFHDRLVGALANAEPTFFDELENAFTSGDHLVIERSLEWAGQKTLHTLSLLPEIQGLRRAIERDPEVLTEVNESIRKAQGGEGFDPATLEAAIALAVGQSLTAASTSPYTANSSIVAVLVAVAAVVAAITVLALQSYAAIFNVAAAVTFAAAVVALIKITVPRRKKAAASLSSGNLLREQLVDSVARYLGPAPQ
ncbi:MAG TPA: hypothetical protein VF121_07965 [Thermoanaerobaculia bacterium]|nr:hypothetical protein [Thermoanaerobaculia bacterium]